LYIPFYDKENLFDSHKIKLAVYRLSYIPNGLDNVSLNTLHTSSKYYNTPYKLRLSATFMDLPLVILRKMLTKIIKERNVLNRF